MKEVVWSVNYLIGFGLIAVAWVLYYILTLDAKDSATDSHNTETHHE